MSTSVAVALALCLLGPLPTFALDLVDIHEVEVPAAVAAPRPEVVPVAEAGAFDHAAELRVAAPRPEVVPVAVVPQLPPQGFLGVALAEVAPDAARAAGIAPGAGASVEDVVPGSPAAAAGIRAGDILVALDGKPVLSPTQLAADVRALAPGTKVKLTIARNGRRQDVEATLAEAPQPPPVQARMLPIFIQRAPDAQSPLDKLVTLDVQASGLGEAILRVLSGTGFPFQVAPELLDDAALSARPFGHKATNTPLSQVLDAVAGHYGIRWSMENGAVSFARR